MKRFSIKPGVHVRISGVRLFISAVDASGSTFTLQDEVTGIVRDYGLEELYGGLENGSLEFEAPPRFEGERVIPPRPSVPISTLSSADQARVKLRLAVLRAVGEIEPGNLFAVETRTDPTSGKEVKATALVHAIAAACRAAGRKPVCVATYYNWLKRYGAHEDASDLVGDFKRRGRKRYLDPEVAQKLSEALTSAIELAKTRKRLGILGRITPKTILATLKEELPEARLPSRSHVRNAICSLPAFDRTVAQKGLRRAENEFRQASAAERPEACLDLVEYDETRLRLVIMCELYGVPLGIPYLSWYVDVASGAPLGFYVGFEPMSDVSTMAALRHACLPKTYMRTEYPGITGTMVAGIPRWVTLDNGRTQLGNTIQDVATDLGFDIRYAPPYCPWFKGAVEGMHKTLNELLLADQSGFNMRPQDRPDDYDPQLNACIGLRHFLQILHHWIADRYMMTGTGPFMLRPIDRWAAGTEKVKPTFPASARDLDLVFGVMRPGTLDHRGVRYENLYYLGPDMVRFRRQHGASVPVDVKPAPHMGRVYWRGPDRVWRIADAVLKEYAWGRSLHNHKLVLRHARDRFGADELDALATADRDLRLLGRKTLPMVLGLRNNARIARAFAIGTERLLAGQGHDGSLDPTRFHTGPLSPFVEQERKAKVAPAFPVPGERQDAQRLTLKRFRTERLGS